MGIRIGYQGQQPSPAERKRALSWAKQFATENEWTCREVNVRRPTGRLGDRQLELPQLEGLAFLPHFACDEVPLIFLESDGTLVDSLLQDQGPESILVSKEALVQTQWGGPCVHEELCDFLEGLKANGVPNLVMDDETGFFGHRDEEVLEKAFEQSFLEVVKDTLSKIPKGDPSFTLASLRFQLPDPSAAGKKPTQEHHSLLESLESWLTTRYGGFGLNFDHSQECITDLDFLMQEADEEALVSRPNDEEAEAFAHSVGACLGNTLKELLGGDWALRPEGTLHLENLGNVGLTIDPFQLCADRLAFGKPHGFGHYFQLFQTLASTLKTAVSS